MMKSIELKCGALVDALAQIPDDERKQAKLDCIIEMMQGEGGNFSAGVYISVLSGFAVACAGIGLDPQQVLRQLVAHAQKETIRLLADQGISLKAPHKNGS